MSGAVTFCFYSKIWRMEGDIEECVSAINAKKANSVRLFCKNAISVQDLFTIPKALKGNYSVTELHMRGLHLTSELIVEIIKSGSNLRTLDFIKSYGFSDMNANDIEKIKAALKKSMINQIWVDLSDMTQDQALSLKESL